MNEAVAENDEDVLFRANDADVAVSEVPAFNAYEEELAFNAFCANEADVVFRAYEEVAGTNVKLVAAEAVVANDAEVATFDAPAFNA